MSLRRIKISIFFSIYNEQNFIIIQKYVLINWFPYTFVKHPPFLTARSCRISISEAFSEIFPTKTVVVGPLPSLSLAAIKSLLWTGGLLTTDTEGTITGGAEVMMPTWTGIIGAPVGKREGMTRGFALQVLWRTFETLAWWEAGILRRNPWRGQQRPV